MRTAQAGMEAERLFCGRYLSDSIGREILATPSGKHGFLKNGTEGEFIARLLDYICGSHVKEQAHVEQWGVLTVRRWLTNHSEWVVDVAQSLLLKQTLTQLEVMDLASSRTFKM